jgi:hypothetical protein
VSLTVYHRTVASFDEEEVPNGYALKACGKPAPAIKEPEKVDAEDVESDGERPNKRIKRG